MKVAPLWKEIRYTLRTDRGRYFAYGSLAGILIGYVFGIWPWLIAVVLLVCAGMTIKYWFEQSEDRK